MQPHTMSQYANKEDMIAALRAENERLHKALDIARTALLTIERWGEEVRTALTEAVTP